MMTLPGNPTWAAPDLRGNVCVVTGASRGAGRGIARVLGECGATVVVTARSSRAGRTTQGRVETVEDAADDVTARGGRGVAVPVDHTDEAQVATLFQRVEAEFGRLDLLVNNAWGGYERSIELEPFWEVDVAHWDAMFDAGLRAHFLGAKFGAPLLLRTPGSRLINTTSPIGPRYHGHLAYDVSKSAVRRLTQGLAEDLRPHGVAALALAPGWMRTERVLDAFGTTREAAPHLPELANTESVEYIGRAVALLAADPDIMRRSGGWFEVGRLALEYPFADVDGRQVPPFSEQYPELFG